MKLVFKSRGTLRETLMRVKTSRPKMLKKAVVHKILCKDCERVYIAEYGKEPTEKNGGTQSCGKERRHK